MAYFNGKQGKWITVKGNHIFIEDGKDIKEAITEFFSGRNLFNYTTTNYSQQEIQKTLENILGDLVVMGYDPYELGWGGILEVAVNEGLITAEQFPELYEYTEDWEPEFDDDKRTGTPLKVRRISIQTGEYDFDIKEHFEKMAATGWYDDNVISMVNKTIMDREKLPKGVRLKSTKSASYFESGRWVVININKDTPIVETAITYFHEMGHASDNISPGEYRSSTYVSKKYKKTMVEMFDSEVKSAFDFDMSVIDEYDNLRAELKKLDNDYWNTGMPYDEWQEKRWRLLRLRSGFADIVQSVCGDDFCKLNFGWTPHPASDGKPYYKQASYLKGTELFAHLTETAADPEKRLRKILSKYCPKTLKIYDEIVEELK